MLWIRSAVSMCVLKEISYTINCLATCDVTMLHARCWWPLACVQNAEIMKPFHLSSKSERCFSVLFVGAALHWLVWALHLSPRKLQNVPLYLQFLSSRVFEWRQHSDDALQKLLFTQKCDWMGPELLRQVCKFRQLYMRWLRNSYLCIWCARPL